VKLNKKWIFHTYKIYIMGSDTLLAVGQICGGSLLVLIGIAFVLFEFIFGIVEAVYAGIYDEYSGECQKIWEEVVFACVIHIISGLLTLCTTKKEDDGSKLVFLVGLGQIAVGIWSFVSWYGITDECRDFWEENAQSLWAIITIHFVFTWIALIIIIIGVIILLGMCVFQCCDVAENAIEDRRRRPKKAKTKKDKKDKDVEDPKEKKQKKKDLFADLDYMFVDKKPSSSSSSSESSSESSSDQSDQCVSSSSDVIMSLSLTSNSSSSS